MLKLATQVTRTLENLIDNTLVTQDLAKIKQKLEAARKLDDPAAKFAQVDVAGSQFLKVLNRNANTHWIAILEVLKLFEESANMRNRRFEEIRDLLQEMGAVPSKVDPICRLILDNDAKRLALQRLIYLISTR